MGIIYEDLEVEGYAARLLPDGTLTGTDSATTSNFGGYVAACECGWRGSSHPPTQEGRVEAEEEWDLQHASPLLQVAIPGHVRDAIAAVRREIAELASERPAAAITAVAEIGRWALVLTKQLDPPSRARSQGRFGLGL
jgi:hypothetical protein